MFSPSPLSVTLFPQHPAPLLPCEQIDARLGIRTEWTESQVAAIWPKNSDFSLTGVQAWSGLPARTLLTPYSELREMLAHLKLSEDTHLVDLGAAYGRLAFLLHSLYPGTRFTGFELVQERVQEGSKALKRFGASHASLVCQDLLAEDFNLPQDASVYFIYDFGSKEGIRKTLSQLAAQARTHTITVIGRGRATRDLIEQENPWLSQIVPPAHRGNYSIYRSHENSP